MKALTRMIEETFAWEAEDGTRFREKKQCEDYENTAIAVAGEAVKRLTIWDASAESAFGCYCTCYDDNVVVFDIKTADDLNKINTLLQIQSKENPIIDPKYVGNRIAFRYYCGETYGWCHGTRAEMEAEFSKLMDKLFKDGDDDVES